MSEHQVLGKSIRKLVQIGNAVGITLPAEYLKAHNLELGQSMEVYFNDVIRVEPLNLEKIRKVLDRGDNEKRKSQT